MVCWLCFFSPLFLSPFFCLFHFSEAAVLLSTVYLYYLYSEFSLGCPSTPPDPTGYQSQAEKHLCHPTLLISALLCSAFHLCSCSSFSTIHRRPAHSSSVLDSFRVPTTHSPNDADASCTARPFRFLPARIPISDGDIAIWNSTLHTIPSLTLIISLHLPAIAIAIGRSTVPFETSCTCRVGWATSVGNWTEARIPTTEGGNLDDWIFETIRSDSGSIFSRLFESSFYSSGLL